MYAELTGNCKNYRIKSLQGNKIVCELADEELHGVTAKEINHFNNEFQDVGYYIDENGYKKFGIIPNKNKPQINYTNVKWSQRDDEIFIRTSRPYDY